MTKTIGSWGCLLVSYNAVARFWELCSDDPPAFMQRMRDAGAMSGPYVLAGALATTFPGKVKYVGYEGRNPAIRQTIINHIDAGNPVFARVDFNTATTIFEQHWVVLVGYTADDYLMIDPWPYPSDSQPVTVSSRYNIPGPDNNILEAIYYELLPDVPPPPRRYNRVCHLLPQDATPAEYNRATSEAYALRQSVLQSIDDALITHPNLTGRKVYVWGDVSRHGAFTDVASFEAWVVQNYPPLPEIIYRGF